FPGRVSAGSAFAPCVRCLTSTVSASAGGSVQSAVLAFGRATTKAGWRWKRAPSWFERRCAQTFRVRLFEKALGNARDVTQRGQPLENFAIPVLMGAAHGQHLPAHAADAASRPWH